jgi:hypothetical protein
VHPLHLQLPAVLRFAPPTLQSAAFATCRFLDDAPRGGPTLFPCLKKLILEHVAVSHVDTLQPRLKIARYFI